MFRVRQFLCTTLSSGAVCAVSSTILSFTILGCSSSSVSKSVEADASVATTVWLDERYGFTNSFELSSLTARITERMSKAAAALAESGDYSIADAKQYSNFPWQVFVLNLDAPTAFSAGAGTIVVSRGLFKRLLTEGELAAIVAHEMSHQLLGHMTQAIEQSGLSEDQPHFAFTLENELAADSVAARLMVLARYDPNDLFGALSRVPEATEKGRDWMIERYANLKRQLMLNTTHLSQPVDSREFAGVRDRL